MIKNWHSLLFGIPLLFLPAACTKDNGSYDIPSEFLEWTLFKEGSTWIYVNETSGNPDTNTVTWPVHDYYSPDSPPAYQYYDLGVSGKFCNPYFVHRAKNDVSLLHVEVKPPFGFSGDVLCQSVDGDFVEQISDHCRTVGSYPSMTIKGNTFSSVVHTRDSTGSDSTKMVLDFYFAKKVGMIMLKARKGEADSTWSLVKWKVSQ